MTTQITNELRNENIKVEVNMIARIEEAIFFVKELGIEWFEENTSFGKKLREIVIKLSK